MLAPSPLTASSDLTSFTILSNGHAVPDSFEILSIAVHRALHRPSTASIVIRDGDASTGEFPVSDSAYFAPGARIQILAGYHGTNAPIFAGMVARTALRQSPDGQSLLTVTCLDANEAVAAHTHPRSPVLTLTRGVDMLEVSLEKDAGSADTTVRGTVKFQGSSLVLPGTMVTLAGLGKRFNGDAPVSGVAHEISEGNWITEVTIGLPPAEFATHPGGGGLAIPVARGAR